VSLILVVLAVGYAIRTEYVCRQIPDRPFQVVGCGFDGAPHCVALKSLESIQRSALAEPPTISSSDHSVRRTKPEGLPLSPTDASSRFIVDPPPPDLSIPSGPECTRGAPGSLDPSVDGRERIASWSCFSTALMSSAAAPHSRMFLRVAESETTSAHCVCLAEKAAMLAELCTRLSSAVTLESGLRLPRLVLIEHVPAPVSRGLPPSTPAGPTSGLAGSITRSLFLSKANR